MHRILLTYLSQTGGCTVCLKRVTLYFVLINKPDLALETLGLFEETDIGLHSYRPGNPHSRIQRLISLY